MIKKYILSLVLLFVVGTMVYGQIGALTPINGSGTWAGRPIAYRMNTGGGTNANNGLEVTLTMTGNIQIRYKGKYQIYSSGSNSNGVAFNPTAPTSNTPTTNGIAIQVDGSSNGTRFGGTLYPTNSYVDPSTIPFQAAQLFTAVGAANITFVGAPDPTDLTGNTQMTTATFNLTIDGKPYPLVIEYKYKYPETRVKVTYKVNIPAGSPNVRVAHGFDTFLSDGSSGSGDNGPGFYTKKGTTEAIMVKKTGIFEAFVHDSGPNFDSWYSAYYFDMNRFLNGQYSGTGFNFGTDTTACFDCGTNINSNSATDNGIGMVKNLGNTQGWASASNYIAFLCNAPDTAPPATSFTPTLPASINLGCTGTAANYQFTGTLGAGIMVQFTNALGTVFNADASGNFSLPVGVYTFYYIDTVNGCTSAAGNFTVNKTCTPCYKNATITTGGVNPVAGISTLVNRNSTANWQNNYKGADMVIESKVGGFVLNRLTQVQISAIPAANLVEGMTVYNITTNKINIYVVDGANTGWKDFAVQTCQ